MNARPVFTTAMAAAILVLAVVRLLITVMIALVRLAAAIARQLR
jgi:hypothetical protein